MGRQIVFAVAVVFSVGCSASGYDGHGVTWKLPRGVSLEAEGTAPGATAMVQFSDGVQLKTYALEGMPTEADEQHLEDISRKVLPPGIVPISKRGGTLPAGKVARFVWTEGPNRTLLYYLPAKSQVVVISLTAPEGTFSSLEDHFDLSLSTLRVR
jgi:hypothetical protein